MKNEIKLSREDIKLMKISSPEFDHLEQIPINYSREGKNINPPLIVDDIPNGTRSLALIVEDPDAPSGSFTHWVVWNIPPVAKIEENSVPGIEGVNDNTRQKYDGPNPPSGNHHYHFKIYALDTLLDIPPHTTKSGLEKAMSENIIGFGEIIGMYQKKFI